MASLTCHLRVVSQVSKLEGTVLFVDLGRICPKKLSQGDFEAFGRRVSSTFYAVLVQSPRQEE